MKKTYYFVENKNDKEKKDYKYNFAIKPMLKINLWKQNKQSPTYSNKNSLSKIKTYIPEEQYFILKHNLSKNYLNKKYIPPSIILEKNGIDIQKLNMFMSKLTDDDVIFLKPSHEMIGSGMKIHILDKTANILEIIDQKYDYVLQKNIISKTIDGHKFDLRIFGLVAYTPTQFACYMYKDGVIRLAQKIFQENVHEFIRNKEFDKIKESHMTNISLYYDKINPDTIKQYSNNTKLFDTDNAFYKYFRKCKKIFKSIMKQFYKKAFVFSNESGFVVFGLDFIIAKNGKVFLIEINQHPTLYNFYTENGRMLSKYLHKSTDEHFFDDFYKLVFDAIIHNQLKNLDYKKFEVCFFKTK